MQTDSPKTNRGSPTASTDEIMLVQETMRTMGLYDGEIDGLPGNKTMHAVRAYKKNNKMPVNNTLSEEFISHLRNET